MDTSFETMVLVFFVLGASFMVLVFIAEASYNSKKPCRRSLATKVLQLEDKVNPYFFHTIAIAGGMAGLGLTPLQVIGIYVAAWVIDNTIRLWLDTWQMLVHIRQLGLELRLKRDWLEQ